MEKIKSLEESRKSLIYLIEWYRDNFFGEFMKDVCNCYIQDCLEAENEDDLNKIDKMIDVWSGL